MGVYRATAKQDPAENRLTEALAAVLERVNGLPHALVEHWTGRRVPPEWMPAIATQRATARGYRIDLEIRFRSQGRSEQVCWVEVKHGADLHGQQLDQYQRDLAHVSDSQQARRDLVLLAPSHAMPSDVPRTVLKQTWQATSRVVAQHLSAATDPVDKWFLEQFISYLKEEQLATGDAFNTEHAMYLAWQLEAERVLEDLHEQVDERVGAKWADMGDSSGYARVDFWSNYPLAKKGRAPREGWKEDDYAYWGLFTDPRPDEVDTPVYQAGLALGLKGSAPHTAGSISRWLAKREEAGFSYLEQGGEFVMIRFFRPEELLPFQTLDDQVEKLSGWVLETFREAVTVPPKLDPE